jgi:3'-phosphoadenosine 5'-phosphosulfate (PAPS) 3'-phosphatase
MSAYAAERAFAISVAIEAGSEIRRQYQDHSAVTYTKADDSPVTDADLASDRIIRDRLTESWPDDAVLTEEGKDDLARLEATRVWIADPIDGTQQFVNRTGQFDVLLALTVDGRPVVAVMLQPTTMIYLAAEIGCGAVIGNATSGQTEPLELVQPGANLAMVTTRWLGAPESNWHLTNVANRLGTAQPRITETGVIIRGHLDPRLEVVSCHPMREEVLAYPEPAHSFIGLPMRGDGTMAWEWDYVAADLVVNEAGGRFTDWHGELFRYNKPSARNEGGLVIANSGSLHDQIIEAVEPEIDLVNNSRREK